MDERMLLIQVCNFVLHFSLLATPQKINSLLTWEICKKFFVCLALLLIGTITVIFRTEIINREQN